MFVWFCTILYYKGMSLVAENKIVIKIGYNFLKHVDFVYTYIPFILSIWI